MNIFFRQLIENDCPKLHTWYLEPIIKKFYANDDYYSLEDIKKKYLPRIQGIDKTFCYIVTLDEDPIGFIQYYALCDHLPSGVTSHKNKLFEISKPENLAGIDMFIAEVSSRGKGFGHQILDQFAKECIAPLFDGLVVDPSVNNRQAIKCFEKCGFYIAPFSETDQNIIMIKKLSNKECK